MDLSDFSWPPGLSKALTKALNEIRERAATASDPPVLLHFTDHSWKHMDRVAENFRRLTAHMMQTSKALNEYELFVGLAACCLHDVALQSPKAVTDTPVSRLEPRDLLEIRRRHPITISNWIRMSVDERERASIGDRIPKLGVDYNQEATDLAGMIADVCKFHSGNLEEAPKKNARYGGKLIRVPLLIRILRLADALDMDQKRVRMDTLSRWVLEPESLLHWWWHHYVASVDIDESGSIDIEMWFPEDLGPPYISFFRDFTEQEVLRELNESKKLLRENHIFADLGRVTWSQEYGFSRRAPPDQLLRLLNTTIKAGPIELPTPEVKVAKGLKKRVSWLSHWGFKGNPWKDLPTAYERANFVLTADIEEKLDELDNLVADDEGEIRILFGERGVGKTTFLKSLAAKYQDVARTCYCDMTGVCSDPPRAREIFAKVFPKVLSTLTKRAVDPEKMDAADVSAAMDSWKDKKPLVLIDNLDRYREKADLPTLREFFQISQGVLQALKTRAVVVISATDEWREDLAGADLSYIGAPSFRTLESFTVEDTTRLIDARLSLAASNRTLVFDDDALQLLHKVARGNPRALLQACETLCHSAASEGIRPITGAFVAARFKSELEHKTLAALLDLADKHQPVRAGIESLYRFHLAIEKSTSSTDEAWQQLLQLLEKGSLTVGSLSDGLALPFSQLAHIRSSVQARRTVSRAWVPQEDLLALLKHASKLGFGARDVVYAYRIHPVHPRGVDHAAMVRRFGTARARTLAMRHIATAQDLLGDLSDPTLSATSVLFKSRFALEHMVVAYLRGHDVALPLDYIEEHREGTYVGGDGIARQKYHTRMRREMEDLLKEFEAHAPRECECLFEMHAIHLRFVETIEKPKGYRKISRAEAAQIRGEIEKVFRILGPQVTA